MYLPPRGDRTSSANRFRGRRRIFNLARGYWQLPLPLIPPHDALTNRAYPSRPAENVFSGGQIRPVTNLAGNALTDVADDANVRNGGRKLMENSSLIPYRLLIGRFRRQRQRLFFPPRQQTHKCHNHVFVQAIRCKSESQR